MTKCNLWILVGSWKERGREDKRKTVDVIIPRTNGDSLPSTAEQMMWLDYFSRGNRKQKEVRIPPSCPLQDGETQSKKVNMLKSKVTTFPSLLSWVGHLVWFSCGAGWWGYVTSAASIDPLRRFKPNGQGHRWQQGRRCRATLQRMETQVQKHCRKRQKDPLVLLWPPGTHWKCCPTTHSGSPIAPASILPALKWKSRSHPA